VVSDHAQKKRKDEKPKQQEQLQVSIPLRPA
jgi:hypothetical protein